MKITLFLDPSCKMAGVKAGRKWIMVGNFWDFHPGCHGIHEYGSFGSPLGLALAVAASVRKQGKIASIWRQFAKCDDYGSWRRSGPAQEIR